MQASQRCCGGNLALLLTLLNLSVDFISFLKNAFIALNCSGEARTLDEGAINPFNFAHNYQKSKPELSLNNKNEIFATTNQINGFYI